MFDRLAKRLWWDKAWSLVDGCTPCSSGCQQCWLCSMIKRWGGDPSVVVPREDRLGIPLKRKKPTVWAIWSDLFHDIMPDWFIVRAFDVMRRCPQHLFIVPTKRAQRMEEVVTELERVLPNVVLMVTAEDQPNAELRMPPLMRCAGWQLGLSCEPLLGPIDLGLLGTCPESWGRGYTPVAEHISWVITGAESGPGRRAMQLDWARSLRDQCAEVDVPFFFKQAFTPRKTFLLDGKAHVEVPDLAVVEEDDHE